MGDILKSNLGLEKNKNLFTILECIRARGPISRAEIEKHVSATPATISRITKTLLDQGVITESGVGKSSGGRPPVLLTLNPQAGYVLGVNLGPGVLEVAITDLEANIMHEEHEKLHSKQQTEVLTELFNLISKIINQSKVQKEEIIGIGVALHGLVDSDTGVSIFAPYYHWHNVPIKELIEDKFGLPTFIDNDVRAMALAESRFGAAQKVEDFVTINVGNGIGSGIIIDNQPHYGVDHSAGEIGHIIVDPDGPQCECGNYGCLTSLASNSQTVKKTKKLIKQGVNTNLAELVNDLDELTVKTICEAAMQDDKLAQQVLKEVGTYLGIGISYLLNILNPKMIVFVGDITEGKDYVFSAIKDVISNRALELPVNSIELAPATLGENTATLGGVTLILRKLFKTPEA